MDELDLVIQQSGARAGSVLSRWQVRMLHVRCKLSTVPISMDARCGSTRLSFRQDFGDTAADSAEMPRAAEKRSR